MSTTMFANGFFRRDTEPQQRAHFPQVLPDGSASQAAG
jgi:hypothetical protein